MGQDAEVVRMLDAGQDIDMQNEEGWTALHVAAEDGNERMVRYLLARGARTDLKTTRGRTAYDVAEGYSAIRAAIRAKMAAPVDPFAPYLGGGGQAPGPCRRARAAAEDADHRAGARRKWGLRRRQRQPRQRRAHRGHPPAPAGPRRRLVQPAGRAGGAA
ncbi:ankyrin repeat domain-containing protein [Phenylobacterium sp. J367]|uniref:ankyrin repeat domain-containing protein n=1 Tax=Phenylobacterium sp. J367 TaxID=2898435 RepID=UPI0021513948|nr:ankyrin repeat domain-containing protein [Phenylobacterium sp. J367]MCR5878745.1 ankyrin repeat domain-containing protein [Phenylobacterium sp. J367]